MLCVVVPVLFTRIISVVWIAFNVKMIAFVINSEQHLSLHAKFLITLSTVIRTSWNVVQLLDVA